MLKASIYAWSKLVSMARVKSHTHSRLAHFVLFVFGLLWLAPHPHQFHDHQHDHMGKVFASQHHLLAVDQRRHDQSIPRELSQKHCTILLLLQNRWVGECLCQIHQLKTKQISNSSRKSDKHKRHLKWLALVSLCKFMRNVFFWNL